MKKEEKIVDLFNCIYRFKNKKGEIIYIGKASSLESRMCKHNHLPEECYGEVYKVEYVCFETEDVMDWAERYYIPKWKPKFNDKMKNRSFGGFLVKELDDLKWKEYKKGLSQNRVQEEKDNRIIEVISGKIFNDRIEAYNEMKPTSFGIIGSTCNGRTKMGKSVNGEILSFMKYAEFKTLSEIELKERIDIALNGGRAERFKKDIKVRCITTGEIFENREDARWTFKTGKQKIVDNLNGKVDEILGWYNGDWNWLKFEYVLYR